MDYQQHRAARRACQGSLSRAAVSARRPVFAAPPHPQGGGFLRAAAPKAAGFPCAVRSAKGVRFSLRRRIRKAAGFPCAVRFARRPALAAPPHPQGGGFPPCGRPKAAGFPCAVRSARRTAFAAPSHSQGGGFSSCGYPQSGRLSVHGHFRMTSGVCRAVRIRKAAGLSVRGPFRKAAGFRRAATMQGGWLWLRPPGGGPRRSALFPLLAGGTHAAFRRAGRAHPLPAAGTKRQAARVLDAGAEGTLGLCQGDPPPFRPPLGPWGGASLSMPGRRKKRAGFAAARR